MNKKLLAVAVAGALAAPGLALAQSAVTISGVFKISLDNIKIGSPAGPGTAASAAGRVGRTSETRIADDSSQMHFNVVEDLGGGLAGIAKLDIRFQPDSGGGPAANGNTWVGLRSKALGTLTVGRWDLHYFGRESNLTTPGSLKGDSISLIAFMQDGTAIAGATRTNNVVRYVTPNWGGFSMVAAYSANPAAASEADIGSLTRAGNAWNFAPVFEAPNWTLGYSHWRSKPDGGGATLSTAAGAVNLANTSQADQRADRLFGSYRWGGFHLGLAWDRSKLTAGAAGAAIAGINGGAAITSGVELGNRTAWSIPIEYKWANHAINFHYTKARDDRATSDQDGAKMIALSYAMSLSKRTTVALTYGKITNDVGAQYNFFTTQGALGSASAAIFAGEDPRFLATTVRHAF